MGRVASLMQVARGTAGAHGYLKKSEESGTEGVLNLNQTGEGEFIKGERRAFWAEGPRLAYAWG